MCARVVLHQRLFHLLGNLCGSNGSGVGSLAAREFRLASTHAAVNLQPTATCARQLLSIAAMALALDQRYRLTHMCCRAFTRILLDVWLSAGLGWQQAGQPHVGVLIQRPRRPAGPRLLGTLAAPDG